MSSELMQPTRATQMTQPDYAGSAKKNAWGLSSSRLANLLPAIIRPRAQGGGLGWSALGWLPGVIQRIGVGRALSRRSKQELGLALNQMQRLTAETEGEVLSMGQQLQEFFLAAQAMTEQGSRMVDLVSGQAMTETTQRLEQLFDEIRIRFEMSQAGLVENLEILASVKQEVAAVSHPLQGFKQMVMGLGMLGISTRIESARMQGADDGFQFLADEVSRLAETIKEQTDGMASLLASLNGRLDETLGSMSGLGAGLNGGMGDLAAVVGKSLEGLWEWRRQSELAAARVATNTQQVHADMAEVVSSMQFHDITRQRLEHVQETLSMLIQGKAEASLDDICGLQSKLLMHAEDELGQAVENMENSLRGIASSVRQVARDSQLLTRGESGKEVSFLEQLGTGLADIISIAAQTEQSLARLRELVESVLATLEQVGSSLSSIDSLSYAIKFVALNAAIKSTRLGSDGAALESIAQAIQHISAESQNATETLTLALGHLGESAKSMRQTMVGESGAVDETVRELESLLGSITADDHAYNELLVELEQNGNDLASRLEAGADNIRFHLCIQQGVSAVMDCLNRLSDQACCSKMQLQAKGRSIQISKNYTMASERRIHQAWAQGGVPAAASPPAAKAPPIAKALPAADSPPAGANEPRGAAAVQDGSELGDNVELF